MKTVREILQLSTSHLEKCGIRNSRRQAEEVMSNALEMPRMDLYMQIDRPLTEKEIDSCRAALKRRSEREPPQYIRGLVEFYHCTFKVCPDVLIPRQETEILVDQIAKSLKNENSPVLWDICCGSGCIGIALKKEFPDLKVVLSDLSKEALLVAEENANGNQTEVELLNGDLLAPFEGRKADYVICNPPYISEQEYTALDPEVREYEPRMALVAGAKGFEFYQRLATELPQYLNNGATVWLEIGATQGQGVKEIFNESCWKEFEIKQDWAGHDRFVQVKFA